MKTIILVEEAGEFTEHAEAHIFDGDIKQACEKAFAKRIVQWAQSALDIEEAILEGDGLVCYTTDEITVHDNCLDK